MIKRLFGIFDFQNPLLCQEEVLGKSFNIMMNGVKGILIMPSLNVNFHDKDDYINGSQPSQTLEFIGDPKYDLPLLDNNGNWGQPVQFPTGNSNVKRAVFVFEFEDSITDLRVNAMVESYSRWLELLQKYYMLIIKIKPKEKGFSEFPGGNLQILSSDGNNWTPCNVIHKYSAECYIRSNSCYVSNVDFQLILDLSSNEREIGLEYSLYLEAEDALAKNELRRSAIEASSALEICLTNKCQEVMQKKEITKKDQDEILRNNSMLSKRFTLCKILGIKLPTDDYQKKIVKIRNKVAHDGYTPSQSEVFQILRDVETYLATFYPIKL